MVILVILHYSVNLWLFSIKWYLLWNHWPNRAQILYVGTLGSLPSGLFQSLWFCDSSWFYEWLNIFLSTTSPLTPLAQLSPNFVCRYIKWTSIKSVQIIVILRFFIILWIINCFPLNDISSETTGLIKLKFCMQVPSVCPLPSLFQSWWFCDSSWFCESFNVFL